jgi:hypothetical protein
MGEGLDLLFGRWYVRAWGDSLFPVEHEVARSVFSVVQNMAMSNHRKRQSKQGASLAYRLPLKLIAVGLFCALGALVVAVAVLV